MTYYYAVRYPMFNFAYFSKIYFDLPHKLCLLLVVEHIYAIYSEMLITMKGTIEKFRSTSYFKYFVFKNFEMNSLFSVSTNLDIAPIRNKFYSQLVRQSKLNPTLISVG